MQDQKGHHSSDGKSVILYLASAEILHIQFLKGRRCAPVAAKFLMDKTWTGQADVPVLGPEAISPIEMAEILSSVLGRPVRYEQTPIEAYKTRIVHRGMSEAFAQGLADMMTAKNEGLDNTSPRAVAADTPTTFRQWSETVLKPAVAG
jgi:uncharacterized protein YbjT (DUF2867 family)